MTIPSEQWLVTALREATARTPLPPESRWIREPGAKTSVWAIAAVVAAAVFLVLVAGAVGALRLEPRVVPSTQYDAFRAADEAAWMRLRSDVSPDLILLRPTWIPASMTGSAECPSPVSSAGPAEAHVRYNGGLLPNGTCAFVEVAAFRGIRATTPDGRTTANLGVDAGTVGARGMAAHVYTDPDDRLGNPQNYPVKTYLWWTEFGATYEILSADLPLADLVRIANSMQPLGASRTPDDVAWMRLRSDVSPDLVLLRPTWMPAQFAGSADCPSPVASALQSYPYERLVGTMRYNGPLRSDGSCSYIEIVAIPELLSIPPVTLIETGTVDARGRVVSVSVNAPHPITFRQTTFLMWHEFGATYGVSSADTTLDDLIRIANGLQPVR